MESKMRRNGIHPLWWTAVLFVVVIAIAFVCVALFAGSFRSFVPVTLASDRVGLVMESGAKVKMRGVEVGRVAGIVGGNQPASLKLEIFPDQVRYIPANIQAEIKATTAFGAKFVDLMYPDNPSPNRLAAGAVLWSRNVTTEVNTVFENLVGLLHQIDVTKLNAVLTALAEGVRGQGQQIGEAITDANEVLLAINPRMDTVQQDWRSFKGFSDAYGAAAPNILATLDAATTTSETVTSQAKPLDSLLLNTIGFSNSAVGLLAPNRDNLVNGINGLAPTTDLLFKYNPEYTCLLMGAQYFLDHGGNAALGGNGRTSVVDGSLQLSADPYKYPENLPIVAAKGGPGGKPGCGSLPDVSKNFPVRYQVTNTGWGTGLDVRPNPGIGHPSWVDFFPVTRAVPEAPSIRGMGPPAIGPVPYPGAPPYGAPLYGPDGSPLYPGVPPEPLPESAPAPTDAPPESAGATP
jgi:phospholipid/cholesterol/gamma-HCH transport system substrate-binding protein